VRQEATAVKLRLSQEVFSKCTTASIGHVGGSRYAKMGLQEHKPVTTLDGATND
jgi:hypothetical protein